ncbi:MAG: lipocalin family protein [Bacteroidota bacterium]
MKKSILPLFLIFLLSGCAQKYAESDLLGKWNVTKWTIETSGKTVNSKMEMNFESDGIYSIDYGSKNENGKYWINGEYLHTVAEVKSEMSVRIMNLKSDTLEIQMNRGGSMERVILLKK